MSATNGEKIVITVGVVNVIIFFVFLNQFFLIDNKFKEVEKSVSNQYSSIYELKSKIDKLIPLDKIQLLEEIQKDIVKDMGEEMIYIPQAE